MVSKEIIRFHQPPDEVCLSKPEADTRKWNGIKSERGTHTYVYWFHFLFRRREAQRQMSLYTWSKESRRHAHHNLGMKFLTKPVIDFLQILVLLAIAPLAFGQQGTIAGTVVDSSGASVAHAKVKLSLD